MSLCGTLSRPIPLQSVAESWFDGSGICIKDIEYPSSGFLNSITLMNDTASVKVFWNGSIHFSGATSLLYFVDVMDRLCHVLSTHMDTTVTLQSAYFIMINAKFDCGRSIPLTELHSPQYTEFNYDPDVYAGARAKMTIDTHTSTIMAFTSGRVIFSGVRHPRHIHIMYTTFCEHLDTVLEHMSYPRLKRNVTSKSKHVEQYRIEHGYSSRILHFYIRE